MLVLSRKQGQTVTVTVPPSDKAQTLVVKLHEIRSYTTAKIGFQADPAIKIERPEARPLNAA